MKLDTHTPIARKIHAVTLSVLMLILQASPAAAQTMAAGTTEQGAWIATQPYTQTQSRELKTTLEASTLETATNTLGPCAGCRSVDLTEWPSRRHQVRAAPSGNSSSVGSIYRGLRLNYDTSVGGWAGGGYVFEDYGTPGTETIDLSAHHELAFGFKGDPAQVKIELVDLSGKRAVVYAAGLSRDEEKVWAFSIDQFSSLDLTKIRELIFVVEGANQTGRLDIFVEPVNRGVITPSAGLGAGDVTGFPVKPDTTRVADTGNPSSIGEIQNGIRIDYDTASDGWAGGGFSFNEGATATPKSIDLTQYENLVFGIQGVADQIKVEIVDNDGNRSVAYLEGFSATAEKYWSMRTLRFSGVDLTRVAHIFFIAEGAHEQGWLEATYAIQNTDIGIHNSVFLKDISTPEGMLKIYSHQLSDPEKLLVYNPVTRKLLIHDVPGIRRADQIKAADSNGRYLIAERGSSGDDIVYTVPLREGLGAIQQIRQPNFANFVSPLGYKELNSQQPPFLKVYYYSQRSNDILYFWNVKQGYYVAHPMQGALRYGGEEPLAPIKAISPDDETVIVRGFVNRIYVASLTNDAKVPAVVNLPVPSGQDAGEAMLESAAFIDNRTVRLKQVGGNEYLLDVVTLELKRVIPEGFVLAASNSNFAFRQINDGGYQFLELLDVRAFNAGDSGAVKRIASAVSPTSVSPLRDVSPDGTTVIYGYNASHHALGGTLYVQSVADTSKKVSVGGLPRQATFASDGTVLAEVHSRLLTGLAETTVVRMSDLAVVDQYSRILAPYAASFHVDQDTPVVIGVRTTSAGERIAEIFSSAQGPNYLRRLDSLSLGADSNASITKMEAFTNTLGQAVVMVSMNAEHFNVTKLRNLTAKNELALDGVVTSFSRSGDILSLQLMRQSGASFSANVDLRTLSLVSTRPSRPVLSAPTGTVDDNTPTFEWSAATNAHRYEIWVNNLSTGQSRAIHETNILTNSYTPTEALANGNYRVWVRAVNAAGEYGSWSAYRDFTVQAGSVINVYAGQSIQAAINRAVPGTEIRVHAGTYSGNLAMRAGIKLSGVADPAGNLPVLKISGWFSLQKDNTLENFRIEHPSTGQVAVYVPSNATGTVIANIRIPNGYLYIRADGTEVRDSFIENNAATALYAYTGNSKFTGNVFYSKSSYATVVRLYSYGTGGNLFDGNTVAGPGVNGGSNSATGIYAYRYSGKPDVITNTVIAGVYRDLTSIRLAPTVRYSLLQSGNTYGSINFGAGILKKSDPQFVNPQAGDFHLQPASPAVNAGDPAGMRPDLGAYPLASPALEYLDADGNRRLSFDELVKGLRDLLAHLNSNLPKRVDASSPYAHFDINGDGVIAPQDMLILANFLRPLITGGGGNLVSEQDRQKFIVFEKIDENNDFQLTGSELWSFRAYDLIDANNDWKATPIEAVNAINLAIRTVGTNNLTYDVTGDGLVTPQDILVMINVRNRYIV